MNRIKELRKSKGLTQERLADIVGVTKLTILRWEKGDRVPKSDKAQQLADYFGVSVSYLLGYSEYENKDEVKNLVYDTPDGGAVAGEVFDWIAQLIGEKRMKRFLENTHSNDFIYYTFIDSEHNLRHTKKVNYSFFSLLDNNDKQLIFDLVKSLSEKINSEEFDGYPLSKRLEVQSKSDTTNP